jgi:alginate O-acetyltransferase complex protein AlgI
MWSLALAIYVGCKWLAWRRSKVDHAPWWQHAGYLLAWPGLDADAFLRPPDRSAVDHPSLADWLSALAMTIAGGLLFVQIVPRWAEDFPLLTGWAGFAAILMMLHFGSFQLLSCAWRTIGVRAAPLMNNPALAQSVSEYWGRRWNTAFRDLTHKFLFRPLASRLGARSALFVGFVFSGLVHDLVISVPAEAGYGGPTLFFVIQAVAILAERSAFGKRLGLGRGWRGWLFTMVVLIGPVGLLFHPPFATRVIQPFVLDVTSRGF